uniref:Uncharacterized protein n=1 Tax=Erpetoichthys calabaricus TaxID=27687 RepID=A0A8C4T2E6_ERPCA
MATAGRNAVSAAFQTTRPLRSSRLGASHPREGNVLASANPFDAAAAGDLASLEKALQDRDVHATNSSGETLLHIAAARGHLAAVQLLLSRGANVNAKDKHSSCPLHLAASGGQSAMVQLLLKNQADPNAVNKEKKMPLHMAATAGHPEVVSLLLTSKARPGAKDMDVMRCQAWRNKESPREDNMGGRDWEVGKATSMLGIAALN